jgi:predicted ArsR family transcriptional regulator
MATSVKTGSQNTIAAYNVLAGDKDRAFTIKEVAEIVGVASSAITGGLVALEKKGLVNKEEVTVTDEAGKEKTYKAYSFKEEVEFVAAAEPSKVTDKGVILLRKMQEMGDADITAADIAAELDIPAIAVNGTFNALVKRGLATRQEAEVTMPDGVVKTLKFLVLTDEGKNYQF